ncbi:UPF0029 family protein [Pelomyxa schiedti]|nr:UPF0029 family protein [Pelomyxa schiedti]
MSATSAAVTSEIEALQAIYGKDFFQDHTGSQNIKIERGRRELVLHFHFPESYPNEPPVFSIRSSSHTAPQIKALSDTLVSQFVPGENTIFNWAQWLQENAFLQCEESTTPEVTPSPIPLTDMAIVHSEPILDRKSKFIAHAARISDSSQVQEFIQVLKSDKSIATATHNVVAHRVLLPNGQLDIQGNDDGETGASNKLIWLLDQRKETDIVVMVTRWYGGIHLGPARFKHIVSVAAEAMDKLPKKT